MTSTGHWKRAALAATGFAGILTGACSLEPPDDATATAAATAAGDDDPPELALGSPSPTLCTSVKMTAPGNSFFATVGTPVTLTAVATCTIGPPLGGPVAGNRPLPVAEYQFWVKPVGAPNWQILGGFGAGSSSWSPPSAGNWAVSVVARALGAPDRYQARSPAVLGAVTVVADIAPVAVDDALTTTVNTPGTTNLLVNDSDLDLQTLSVTSFTQGAHGTVTVTAGIATYTPAPDYVGSDSFTYTVDDGAGMSDTGSVAVTVNSGPACTISVTGSGSSVFGELVRLVSFASCAAGPAEVQWYQKVNSAYVVVQPFTTQDTIDLTGNLVGRELFYALVRTQGTTRSQGMSNIISIPVVDNTPQCTQVRMVAPSNDQTLGVGQPHTLTASASCPDGSTPEYQFWVKPTGDANWQILPSYTTGDGSWTPPATGGWSVKAVVRTTGSHVGYQVASMAVSVNVIVPGCVVRPGGPRGDCR